MRYAVLLKTHYWNDFIAQQAESISDRVRDGDVFILKDETARPYDVDGDYDVHACNESAMEDLDLLIEPKGQVFWYNVDYPLYAFFSRHPSYDYYVMLEYDVVVQCELDGIVRQLFLDAVDFVGRRIADPLERWHWTSTCDGFYTKDEIRQALCCFSIFSRRAVASLYAARRSQKKQKVEQGSLNWPFCEAFIPSEIARAKMNSVDLGELGTVFCYDRWPPYLHCDPASYRGSDFVHPVLDLEAFMRSSFKHGDWFGDFFNKNSLLSQRLRSVPQELVWRSLYEKLESERDGAKRLAVWKHINSIVAARSPAGENVAVHGRASQSSVCSYSRKESAFEDAVGAISGLLTGDYGFHTALQERPWWMLDLGCTISVEKICIYNRTLHAGRAAGLIVASSENAVEWHEIERLPQHESFGGIDGSPLVITFDKALPVRFLRLSLPAHGILHLDEIQVYERTSEET